VVPARDAPDNAPHLSDRPTFRAGHAVWFGESIPKIIHLPDVHKRMSTLGLNLEFCDNDQFRELIARDQQKYGTVIREARIRPA
jgi:tripartite-type tricarboxylate transporter receptor subunit TctC